MPTAPLRPPAVPPDPRPLLSPVARTWLDESAARIAARPTAIRALFPAARRRCGQAPLDEHWTTDEAVRAVLLATLPLRGQDLADEVAGLYRHGDPAEQRAILRSLPLLAASGDDPFRDLALTLIREALRGNDTSVVETALGPYAAAHLPEGEFRQAVLKCVFLEIPLARVTGLDLRADRELARMLADFAHERVAAGREVPQDVWPLVRPHRDIADTLAARARALAPTRPEAVTRALAALGAAAPLEEES
ncbi:EboA domain-containing protein [Streptomyces sp. NPDC007901]|uniref:EboA domain-containing protein n=1 Tax=Streptomyces sp. NPDC007901 TaxID=3364785 RepID=UPI0036DFFD01